MSLTLTVKTPDKTQPINTKLYFRLQQIRKAHRNHCFHPFSFSLDHYLLYLWKLQVYNSHPPHTTPAFEQSAAKQLNQLHPHPTITNLHVRGRLHALFLSHRLVLSQHISPQQDKQKHLISPQRLREFHTVFSHVGMQQLIHTTSKHRHGLRQSNRKTKLTFIVPCGAGRKVWTDWGQPLDQQSWEIWEDIILLEAWSTMPHGWEQNVLQTLRRSSPAASFHVRSRLAFLVQLYDNIRKRESNGHLVMDWHEFLPFGVVFGFVGGRKIGRRGAGLHLELGQIKPEEETFHHIKKEDVQFQQSAKRKRTDWETHNQQTHPEEHHIHSPTIQGEPHGKRARSNIHTKEEEEQSIQSEEEKDDPDDPDYQPELLLSPSPQHHQVKEEDKPDPLDNNHPVSQVQEGRWKVHIRELELKAAELEAERSRVELRAYCEQRKYERENEIKELKHLDKLEQICGIGSMSQLRAALLRRVTESFDKSICHHDKKSTDNRTAHDNIDVNAVNNASQ